MFTRLRITLQDGLQTRPVQRFPGLRAKTDLPTTKAVLKPSSDRSNDRKDMTIKQQKVNYTHDKHPEDVTAP